jgi:hypothetical protein
VRLKTFHKSVPAFSTIGVNAPDDSGKIRLQREHAVNHFVDNILSNMRNADIMRNSATDETVRTRPYMQSRQQSPAARTIVAVDQNNRWDGGIIVHGVVAQ